MSDPPTQEANVLEYLLHWPDPKPWREVSIDLAQLLLRKGLPLRPEFKAYLAASFEREIREARGGG